LLFSGNKTALIRTSERLGLAAAVIALVVFALERSISDQVLTDTFSSFSADGNITSVLSARSRMEDVLLLIFLLGSWSWFAARLNRFQTLLPCDKSVAPRLYGPAVLVGAVSVLVILGFILLRYRPGLMRLIFEKEGGLETTTAVLYGTAAMISIATWWRYVRTQEAGSLKFWKTCGLLALGIVCIAIAMEELSWGQHLLGFSSIGLFKDANVQGEFNLHNFMDEETLDLVTDLVVLGIFCVTAVAAWWRQARPNKLLQSFGPDIILVGMSVLMLYALLRLHREIVEFLLAVGVIYWAYMIMVRESHAVKHHTSSAGSASLSTSASQ
jgi:hypothetical protein